jgi:hypothetical protein
LNYKIYKPNILQFKILTHLVNFKH